MQKCDKLVVTGTRSKFKKTPIINRLAFHCAKNIRSLFIEHRHCYANLIPYSLLIIKIILFPWNFHVVSCS